MSATPAAAADPAAGSAESHPRRWATLAALCVGLFVISLDNTVLNVALPSLARELHASGSDLQWMVDGYTLAFAGLLLTAGSWGDKYGRRRALNLGLTVFAAASAWGAFSGSATELIVARTAMGVGAALVMPSTLSILTNLFTDPAERKRAIGIWAAVSGLGIAVGPAMGGWLLEHYWWGAVFAVNVPVAAVAAALGARLVPESKDLAAPRLDLLGALLSTLGLTTLVWAIIEAPQRGWTDPVVLGLFAGATLVLAGFTRWELRVADPLLDLRFFASRRFSASAVSVTLVFFALLGSVFFMTIYMQGVLAYPPLEAGLRLTPIAAGLIAGTPVAMQLAKWTGEKVPVVLGLLLLAVSLWVVSRTSMDSGYGPLLAAIVLMGFGISIALAPATEAVMGSLPRAKAGVGSAVNDTTRQVGGALGVAVLGSILHSVYRARMEGTVAGLPPEAARAASDNLEGATAVASRLGGERGAALLDASQLAFVQAMDRTVAVGAAVALLGALVALIWLPHHGVHPDDVIEALNRDLSDNAGDCEADRHLRDTP
jgi:MFS transporter, DHA2 family, multidrug resistance protein